MALKRLSGRKKASQNRKRQQEAQRQKQLKKRLERPSTRKRTPWSHTEYLWPDGKYRNEKPKSPPPVPKKFQNRVSSNSNTNKSTSKSKSKPYVDPDAADKKAESVFRSSSSVAKAKAKHAKKESAKNAGKVEREANEWGPGGQPSAKKQLKIQSDNAKKAWLKKTRNSPAAQAGISDDRRWKLHQKNKDFKSHRKAGTLDKFAKKYPDSQTAKKRKKRLRIPSPLDMD